MKPAGIVSLTVTVTLLFGLTTSHADTPVRQQRSRCRLVLGCRRPCRARTARPSSSRRAARPTSSVSPGIVPQVQALGLKTLVYDRADYDTANRGRAATAWTSDRARPSRAPDRSLQYSSVRSSSSAVRYSSFVERADQAEDPADLVGQYWSMPTCPAAAPRHVRTPSLRKFGRALPNFREPAPQLAATMIKMMEACTGYHQAVEGAQLPQGLTIMDVSSRRGAGRRHQPMRQAIHDAHAAFVHKIERAGRNARINELFMTSCADRPRADRQIRSDAWPLTPALHDRRARATRADPHRALLPGSGPPARPAFCATAPGGRRAPDGRGRLDVSGASPRTSSTGSSGASPWATTDACRRSRLPPSPPRSRRSSGTA